MGQNTAHIFMLSSPLQHRNITNVMDSEQQPPANNTLPPLPSKKNPRYPSKTCKYAGVTFRASRDKYQARIYKGNKEYNLGLFDVSSDAALAYDVAHRLVKKISAAHGKEKETLEAHEADKDAPDWLDYGEAADANSGLDPDKLNFLRPLDFKVEREKELNESRCAGTQKHENCPKLEELRVVVHKEAIRVVKIIVGAIDGGTNNYRRKGKKAAASLQDGALRNGALKGPTNKKRRKTKDAVSSNKGSGNGSSDPNVVTSAWVGKDAAEAYYQASGLGRPVPNPSRNKKKDHPFGPPPVVPVGPMARGNPQLMRHMNKSTLKAMMDDTAANPKAAAEEIERRGSDEKKRENGNDKNGKDGAPENQTASSSNADSNSFFSQDTMQAGNVSNKANSGDFNFMAGTNPYMIGMACDAPGTGGGGDQGDFGGQTPENYREFFKNMRNFFPGMAGGAGLGQMGGQGYVPEDFQRMMMMRAMGHNAGMPNGMGMMGMDNTPGLNQGHSSFANGFGDQQKKDNSKKLENLKSMMQAGDMDRAAAMMPRGGGGGPDGIPGAATNPGRLSPTTLNMLRATGGFPPSAAAQATGGPQGPFAAAQERAAAMAAGAYGMDRFGQQLRALQSSQFGLSSNPATAFGQFGGRPGEGGAVAARGSSDPGAFLGALGQSGFPPGAGAPGASSGGGFINPAFDEMSQLFGMAGSSHQSSRNKGGGSDKREI